MSEAGEQWKPFTSTQRVVTRRPGFDLDGRIALLPGGGRPYWRGHLRQLGYEFAN